MISHAVRVGGPEIKAEHHINDEVIRSERLPNIWCPGCGIGIVVGAYVRAIQKAGIPRDRQISVSGIGCTGRVSGYLNLDSYHTTHGRAIPFATGMSVVRPDLEITVIAGDGDLGVIGGNHLIHAARRNVDLNVMMVLNFYYGLTGGQHGGTTALGA